MYRRMLAIAVVITAIFGMFYKTDTALAADNTGQYICWGASVSLPAQCMDLKDDTFQANQPIYLWSSSPSDPSGPAHGLGWHFAYQSTVVYYANNNTGSPFTDTALDRRYNGDAYYYLEKTTATGHNGCVGLDSNYDLAWEPCGTAFTWWVFTYPANYLVNVGASNVYDTPLAAAACSTSDGSTLFVGFVFESGGDCTGSWTPV